MQLLGDPECFSRFQLVPHREVEGKRNIGEDALAGSALSAFSGFLSRDFRVHDFLLGRHNMEYYLRRVLTLKGNNSLFNHWSDDLRKEYACTDTGQRVPESSVGDRSSYFLPIVPITTDVVSAPLPDWPKAALDIAELKRPADKRIEKILNSLLSEVSIPSLLRPVVNLLIDFGLSNKLVFAAIEKLETELKTKMLL